MMVLQGKHDDDDDKQKKKQIPPSPCHGQTSAITHGPLTFRVSSRGLAASLSISASFATLLPEANRVTNMVHLDRPDRLAMPLPGVHKCTT